MRGILSDGNSILRMRCACASRVTFSRLIYIINYSYYYNKPALLYAVWYEKVLRLHRKVKAACVAAHRAYA
jgi:hypothetical protein